MGDIVLPNMYTDRKYGLGFSHDERAELEKKASTENLLNAAAQQTGKIRKDEHVDVHGDDASFDEVKAGQQPWAEPLHTAADLAPDAASTAYDLAEIFAEKGLANLLGEAAEVAPPLFMATEIVSTMKTLPDAWERGDQQHEAILRDTLHIAVVETVQGLPEGFRKEEETRRKEAYAEGRSSAPWQAIQTALIAQKGAVPLLQLRTDEGMSVAENAIRFGLSKESALQTKTGTTNFAERYAKDPAFRSGYDAVMWARAHGAAELQKVLEGLHARDARFDGAHNQIFRG